LRILIVARANKYSNELSPFVIEQAESLCSFENEIEYFKISGKGWRSYLIHIFKLRRYLSQQKFDIIHAHYVWSAIVAVSQRFVPVVATFHGSDLNRLESRIISNVIVYPLASRCIVVNEKMRKYILSKKTVCIPCGVDIELFKPVEKNFARNTLNMKSDIHYILFCSSFNRKEKNAELAKKAVSLLKNRNVILIEFKGYTRDQAVLLFSAVDLLLMTSLYEGSPQVIKEAMACNCPIVSTDVGDVKYVIGETANCYICNYDPFEIASRIDLLLSNQFRTDGRERIIKLGLTIDIIANKINNIYEQITLTNG